MSEPVELKISSEVIKPIIQAKINTAIIEALGGHKDLIESFLDAWMTRKVDSDGKESNYNSTKPRIDYLLTKMLEEALKESLAELLKQRKGEIALEFAKYFKTKAGSNALMAALQNGVCKSLESAWMTSISFHQLGDR